ncbi:hypothetical protein F511_29529 [Dorcoceras hygrometricum]|uniref:Uncharacterized protein n=1 Tax=Dorcoceras hygrometricum TaxID=472368 RepID=A0A2Z7C814_9LAMI|nr:hypothetical protein F511_29529 [Dorcoceras hygrometricum]
MGSNPSTESNYKTTVNIKNKMQMLCMRPGTTAEGYNQGREPKNSMHSSTEFAIDKCGHGECRTCGRYPLTPTRPPIPDASIARPAVAQPMNCGVAKILTQRKNSAQAQSSSRHESAAKQLTIYESWMSNAELNSNGKNAQDGKNQWLRFSQAIYAKATPLKKVDDVGATTALLQKYIDYTVHQQRENEKKDEAIDRH